jgi:hypothetical protein
MLHELKALIGSTVTASDGETGSIRTFFFDDQSWKVSYLVVDVGGWLKRRDVLLPVAALFHSTDQEANTRQPGRRNRETSFTAAGNCHA